MKTKSRNSDDRVRLSNEIVAALALPAKGAVTRWDNDPRARGFGVRVYATGTRSFFINYWMNGMEKRLTIGPFPRWSVSLARERAIELRRDIDRGRDPAGEKRQRREAPTIADLIERYAEEVLARKERTKDRIKGEQKVLALIGSELGMRTPVASVHDGDIKAMHRRLTEARGPVAANRYTALASKMFTLSLQTRAGEDTRWRDAKMGNPCKGVEKNREEGRERFFSFDELARIADALVAYPAHSGVVDCLRLIMLTGCRPQEAMLAEWSEFATPGQWIKPSSHVKQKKTHTVFLEGPALELIERVRQQRGESKYVFPGRIPGKRITKLTGLWGFVKKHAALTPDAKGHPARVYDLRHSYASVAAGRNYSLPLIGRLLGHTQPRTTAKYAHLADDPLREAASRISRAISEAGRAGGADVVPIPRRKSH
jgi:integrase